MKTHREHFRIGLARRGIKYFWEHKIEIFLYNFNSERSSKDITQRDLRLGSRGRAPTGSRTPGYKSSMSSRHCVISTKNPEQHNATNFLIASAQPDKITKNINYTVLATSKKGTVLNIWRS